MKNLKLIFILIVWCQLHLAEAQNLVPNPSFELHTNAFCGLMYTNDFENSIDDWVNPNASSPDAYFTFIDEICYNHVPSSSYSGPIGIKGEQSPHTGRALTGLWLYTIDGFNQRDYVQIELTTPMEIGKSYEVGFYASLADNMEFYINRLGGHLSVDPITQGNGELMNYTPQLVADDFVNEYTEWVWIGDTIVAQENYKYITIGNFFDDSNTPTMSNPNASGGVGTYGAYYYIDDVVVQEVDVSTSTYEVIADQLQIYPNPVSDQLFVRLDNLTAPVRVEVLDAIGRSIDVNVQQVGENLLLQCNHLSAGVYILGLQTAEGTYVEKFVVY